MRIIFLILLSSLLCVQLLTATESRIESMGKKDVFFRDDMSVFRNPANIGVHGNFIIGSVGFANDVNSIDLINPRLISLTDTITVIDGGGDTLRMPRLRDSLALDTVKHPETSVPTNQWFGVAYNFGLNKNLALLLGAAFNRDDEFFNRYDLLRGRREYKSGVVFPELKGKSDFLLGARFGKVNAGIGYYHASQEDKYQGTTDTTKDKTYGPEISLSKITAGTEISLKDHSLEVFGGFGMLSYASTDQSPELNIASTTDNSVFAGARFFFQTRLGGGLVFVPAVNFSGVELFDSSASTFSGGVGANLRLQNGFFWCGLEGEGYSAENDSLDTKESGYGVHFNFGIEKSLIWKWLTVRVGGHKYFGVRTLEADSIETREWVENASDDGLSDDFLRFALGLNYQNRLRFDITLNEWVPYFNPFGRGLEHSPNGGHMLLRICSTFSL